MKKSVVFLLLLLFLLVGKNHVINAQGVGLNTNGNPPDSSAMLDISSTSKGLLLPRMTTQQRNNISNPAEGLQIFNTTTKCLEYFVYGSWQSIHCASCPPTAEPVSGTHVPSASQIVWNWSAVSGATGYKYNTTNNYASATDIGNNTSYTQTSLTCNSAYTLYVWSYSACSNSASPVTLTASTAVCPFVCGTSTLTDIDGNVYNTVAIGSQCWMKQNLNTTRTAAGTAITRYCYNNNTANCTTYGGLYKWTTMVQSSIYGSSTNPSGVQGICPTGWHIPSDAEYKVMEQSLGMSLAQANATGWRTTTNEGAKIKTWDGGTNSSGFTALPAGLRNDAGGYEELNVSATFWTSTSFNDSGMDPYVRSVTNNQAGIYRGNPYINILGFSVRCVKD